MRSGPGAIMVAAVLVGCGGAEEAASPPSTGTTIRGVVDGTLARPPASPHVGLIYPSVGGGPVAYHGDTIEVGRDFPAAFELQLDHRPPAGSIGSYWNEDGTEDARMAMAFAWAFDDVDGDGAWAEDARGGIEPDRLLGIAMDTLLVYIERAPLEGGAGDQVFENPGDATVGYHLARPVCGDGNELGKLRILPADARLEVTVPESEEDIEFGCLDFAWPSSQPF
jgi:hypothetical protein